LRCDIATVQKIGKRKVESTRHKNFWNRN